MTIQSYIIHDAERGAMTKVRDTSLAGAIRKYLARWLEDLTPEAVRTMQDLDTICGDMGITVVAERDLDTL